MESTLSLNTWKRFVNEGALESSRLNGPDTTDRVNGAIFIRIAILGVPLR